MKCASNLLFRAAFGKESEVLIGNLGDKLIPPQDILRDVSDLKALANMHESLEWLASRTKSAFSNLSTSQSKYLVGSCCGDSWGTRLNAFIERWEYTLVPMSGRISSCQKILVRILLVLHLSYFVIMGKELILVSLCGMWEAKKGPC